jgi:hypothetical protein
MAKGAQTKKETDSGPGQAGTDVQANGAAAEEGIPKGKLAFAIWLIVFAMLAGYSLFDLLRAQFR